MCYNVRVHCGCENKFPIQFKNGEYVLTPQWEQPSPVGLTELPLIFKSICEWHNRGGKVQNITLEKVD